MGRLFAASLGLVLLALVSPPAQAAISIDWVQIGSPGNPADTDPNNVLCGPGFNLPCGAVADPYRIGKYEVTNAQYADFLNAVADADPNALYSTGMANALGGITRSGSSGSFSYAAVVGRENKPVNYVSWYDALRFVNWLANGQPTGAQGAGTTEAGTYTLTGINSIAGGRASGAGIVLPTEDEWYKAAYFDPAMGLYYDYPAGTDTQTVCATPTAIPNRANCHTVVGNTTDVGSYTGSASPFGTFDQGGNVNEWNEADIFGDGSGRGLRGGFWFRPAHFLAASSRFDDDPAGESDLMGFRVASVPEPGTGLLVMAGLLGLARWRRRRV